MRGPGFICVKGHDDCAQFGDGPCSRIVLEKVGDSCTPEEGQVVILKAERPDK